VYARGLDHCQVQVDQPEDSRGVVELDLELTRGVEVRGRVVDVDGSPVTGCYVAAVAMTRDSERHECDWRSVRTDADGRFAIGALRKQLSPVLLVRRDGRATLMLPIGE